MPALRSVVCKFALLTCAVGVVGCGESGSVHPGSLTAPSALSADASESGGSASFSVVPEAGIHAEAFNGIPNLTGLWKFQVRSKFTNGSHIQEEFQAGVVQDSQGNAAFADEDGNLVTLTLRSRTYTRIDNNFHLVYDLRLAVPGGTGECDALITGQMFWNIGAPNVTGKHMFGQFQGIENDCQGVKGDIDAWKVGAI